MADIADLLPEDVDERRWFDADVTNLCEGSALRRVALALEVWHRSEPGQGSYGKNLAIMANECRKAADEIERLRAALQKIADMQDLLFAECDDAEFIVTTARAALSLNRDTDG